MSSAKKNNTRTLALRAESTVWCLVILGALAACVATGIMVNTLYRPDTSSTLLLAYKLLANVAALAIQPEPKENLIFLVCLATLCLALPGLYLLAKDAAQRFPGLFSHQLFSGTVIFSVLALSWLGYAGLEAANPFATATQGKQDLLARTNWEFYFRETWLNEHALVYAIIVFPLLLLSLTILHADKHRTIEAALSLSRRAAYLWYIALFALVLSINTFVFPYTSENKQDFGAVYYSMVQVYHGSPMLVDGFTNTYGLYPHFLVPLFKIIGLNVLTFSGTMAVLVVLCYLAILVFLCKTVTNRLLVFLAFNAIIFTAHFQIKVVANFDSFFASQPIRFLLPVTALVFSVYYQHRKSQFFYFFSLFFLSFGVLWNPEFGILTLLAYVMFLCYTEFQQDNWRLAFGKILRHNLTAACILLLSFCLYALAIRVGYGAFPNMSELFSTISVFSVIGFNMLPMPLLHPWNLVALTFAIGLLVSAAPVINHSTTHRHAVIFLVTLLGIASFTYYQGRSHNWTLLVPMVYFFILLALFADSMIGMFKQDKIFAVPLVMLVFILGPYFLQVSGSMPVLAGLITEQENKEANLAVQNTILANALFIKENSQEGEPVLVMGRSRYQALYHGIAERPSAFNPGYIDLFLSKDANRLFSFLMNNPQIKIFREPRNRNSDYNDPRIALLLSKYYAKEKSNGTMSLFRRKGL